MTLAPVIEFGRERWESKTCTLLVTPKGAGFHLALYHKANRYPRCGWAWPEDKEPTTQKVMRFALEVDENSSLMDILDERDLNGLPDDPDDLRVLVETMEALEDAYYTRALREDDAAHATTRIKELKDKLKSLNENKEGAL